MATAVKKHQSKSDTALSAFAAPDGFFPAIFLWRPQSFEYKTLYRNRPFWWQSTKDEADFIDEYYLNLTVLAEESTRDTLIS